MIKYDDVGSLPLPEKVDSQEFGEAFVEFEDWALKIYQEMLELKIDSGVQVPCYPQLRDMNDQFLKVLNNQELIEEPYLVYEEKADIPEFVALEKLDLELPELKACVTGPLELSISEFEGVVYEDLMMNMARSLKRFIERAESFEGVDIQVVSVDEPSLGINPDLSFESESLVEAWDIVGDVDAEVQVHLHSPLYYETACESDGIDIIDIGAASSPDNLDQISSEFLDSHETKLRVGISRTDILSISAEYNEKNDVNIWSGEEAWNEFLSQIEPPEKIADRVGKIYEEFGDLIEYFGPDCGLGGAKRLELAEKILKNTKSGIQIFYDR